MLEKEVIIFKFPVHGDLWWQDGEFWARKGVGRVRVAPSHNLTLDIFLTSLAANDYNSYYRQVRKVPVPIPDWHRRIVVDSSGLQPSALLMTACACILRSRPLSLEPRSKPRTRTL